MNLESKLCEILSERGLAIEGEVKYTNAGLVAFVNKADDNFVLKIFNHSSDEKLSASVLKFYGGKRAVEVIGGSTDYVLLQRVIPGYSLASCEKEVSEEENIQIFCDVVKSIHDQDNIEINAFPKIEDICQKEFFEYSKLNKNIIPSFLIERAKGVFNDLINNSQQNMKLLHGDLHHENILFDSQKGWIAIDPKGIIGEAEMEVAAFLKNPIGRSDIYLDDEIIRRRIGLISHRLNFDGKKVASWGFVMTVVSSIWLIEDGQNADGWLELAKKLEKYCS